MTWYERRLRQVPPVAAAIVVLIGALVLVGWAFDIELLKSLLHPQRTAMNPATATSFLLAGLALWALRDEPTPPPRRRVAQVCGAAITWIAALRLLGYALKWSWGVDQILFSSRLAENVMAPNTAATFLLIGLALIVLDEETRRRFHPAQILVFAAGGVALFSLAGYLYSSSSLTGMSGYIPMALNTTIAFGVLCIGLACARPTRQPVATLVTDTLGGTMARRLVPAALLVPPLLGWLCLRGAALGFFDAEAGLALFVLANIIVFNLLIWWCGQVVRVSDVRRRLSEEVLRQNDERHRAVMEQAAEGIYLLDLDTKRVLDANPAFERLLGYAHGELLTTSVYDLVNDSPAGIDERLQRLVRGGAPTRAERSYRRKDGSLVDVGVSSAVISYGNRRVACTVVHDITEQKKAEALLKASEARGRLIVETALDAFVAMDADGRIVDWNAQAQETFGWTREQALGRVLADTIIPPHFRDAHAKGLAHYIASGEGPVLGKRLELVGLHRAGLEFPVEITIVPAQLGGTLHFFAFIHDITERKRIGQELEDAVASQREALEQLKRAQSQLVQSEKLVGLGQMVAGVAHEINNPLAFVSNNVAVLQRDAKSLAELLALYQQADKLIEERNGQLLQAIRELSDRVDLTYTLGNLDEVLVRSRDGLRRIQQIVKDLRDFARLGASDRADADLNAGVESTVNIIQGHARKKRVTIEQKLGALPRVSCDPAKVNQVIMNLVANAIDASPEGGRVTIATKSGENGVSIEVSDTGPGVPGDIRQRIFDPFFTTKPLGEGTGLGLSISYGIVKEHGGTIEVTDAPGGGARFVVWLPVNTVQLDD